MIGRLAAAALACCIAGGAAAQPAAPRWNPRAPENGQLLAGFSYASVEPVLTAIGARFQRGRTPGAPQLLVNFANGRRATLVMSSCDPAGLCKALSIQSFWTPLAGIEPAKAAAAIETFNQRYAFAKAFLAIDGRPALQRYLTADYGFVRGNLAVNLLVFSNQADSFAKEVLQPLAVAAKPVGTG